MNDSLASSVAKQLSGIVATQMADFDDLCKRGHSFHFDLSIEGRIDTMGMCRTFIEGAKC
jgi:hypothetical protein